MSSTGIYSKKTDRFFKLYPNLKVFNLIVSKRKGISLLKDKSYRNRFSPADKFRAVNYGRINLKVLIPTEYSIFKWVNSFFCVSKIILKLTSSA